MTIELHMEDVVEYDKTQEYRGHIQPPSTTAEFRKRQEEDFIRIDLKIESGIITDAKYSGFGSVLSKGISAHICSRVIGMSVEEAATFELWPEIHFSILPNRRECAMLGFYALREALNAYAEDSRIKRPGS